MSRVAKIKNVSYIEKTLSLDFNKLKTAVKTPSVYAKKTNHCIDDRFSPERIYYVCDNLYFYSGEKMYSLSGSSEGILIGETFVFEPYVVAIKNNYEDSYLVFDSEKATFVFDEQKFDFFGEEIHAVVRGMLFQGYAQDVYVVKDFCITGESQTYSNALCFKIEKQDGQLYGIAEYGDCALLLCEHKIIKVSLTKVPGDIVVERLLTPYFTAKKGSLTVCGDKVTFIAEEGLGILDGNKLSFVKLPFGVEYRSGYGHCSFNGSLYVIPYIKNKERFLCVYDVIDGTFTEIKTPANNALSKNGAFFLGDDGYVYRIVKGESVEEEIFSDEITTDFNCCGKKLLRGIEIHSSGEATLNVLSDGGEKTFIIKEGCNKFYCNLCSEKFTLKFINKSQSFQLGEVKLRYTILGG